MSRSVGHASKRWLKTNPSSQPTHRPRWWRQRTCIMLNRLLIATFRKSTHTHIHRNDGARYILVDSIKSVYRVFGLSKLTKEKTNKNGRKQLDMCPLRMHFNFKFDSKWRSMSLCGRGPWCASLHPRVDIKLRCGNTKAYIDTKWTKLKLLYDCLTMRRTHTFAHILCCIV